MLPVGSQTHLVVVSATAGLLNEDSVVPADMIDFLNIIRRIV